MWKLAGLHKQQGLAGCIHHKNPTVEGEVRLPSGLLMHINPHLHLNDALSALTAGFLTGQFRADSGSKRMFFYDETSHSDLVEALFSRGGPPQLENCPTRSGKNVNTIKIHHVALLTSIPDKKKVQLQQNCGFLCMHSSRQTQLSA